jgi:chromosome condensin MukBEF complex kleisin-like MukF subunit
VIVRIMGEGQYRVEDSVAQELNELDEQVATAVERGDEEGTRGLLQQLATTVRDRGERLDDGDLSPSDAIVPPEDLSLDEVRELLEGEGLIPDLPEA